MKGIYCFTNKINNKKYIGQSIQLKERYSQHKRNYLNQNDRSYNSNFYRAIRKYGFENFTYEILENNDSLTKEELNELEVYYINLYDSFKNGYNETPGGQTGTHFVKLSEDSVFEIKEQLKNTSKKMEDIAKDFNVSISLISMINNGKTWHDNKYNYPIRDFKINRARGERVNTAIFSDKEVLQIRKKYVKCSLLELYEEYKDRCSFHGLKKIVYGVNHKHLPLYKKKEKQWILNGTCIDYPG